MLLNFFSADSTPYSSSDLFEETKEGSIRELEVFVKLFVQRLLRFPTSLACASCTFSLVPVVRFDYFLSCVLYICAWVFQLGLTELATLNRFEVNEVSSK